MKPKELKALQNTIALFDKAEAAGKLADQVVKDLSILKAYLKGALEGDGSIRQKDFEMIWEQYPNRVGKKAAERHFFGTVKKAEDIQRIWKALDNYIQSDKAMKGFLQNGSTWFNDWQSWENPTPAMMGTAAYQASEAKSRSESAKEKFIKEGK
jgi:hypothetical protein